MFSETELEIDLFTVSMWWRVIYGTFRVVVGVLLLRVIHHPFDSVVAGIMHTELVEHPNDTILFHFLAFLQQHPFTITYFFAFYIIFWGAVDIVLSVSLLRHQLWAFPFSLLLIASFMFYEIIRYTHTHSHTLLILLCIDTFVFWLIYREYQRMLTKHEAQIELTT